VLETAALELTEAGACAGTVRERAQVVLDVLARHVPYDAAWLATAEPTGHAYTFQASASLARSEVGHLAGPEMSWDTVLTPTGLPQPCPRPSERLSSAAEFATRAACLAPNDVREALAVALVDHHRRHIGVLALLYGPRRPPQGRTRRALDLLVPVVAHAVDPLLHLTTAVQLLAGAHAGAVLYPRGERGALPGLGDDALLATGSPLLAAARSALAARHPSCTFLWPRGGRHAPEGHTRVTVLADGPHSPASGLGAVVLSESGNCRGLTPRELEVLGLLVAGRSNAQIAHTLVLTPRTVATHLEHILHKLEAPTRTLAAVRADREGLYVPSAPGAEPESGSAFVSDAL